MLLWMKVVDRYEQTILSKTKIDGQLPFINKIRPLPNNQTIKSDIQEQILNK